MSLLIRTLEQSSVAMGVRGGFSIGGGFNKFDAAATELQYRSATEDRGFERASEWLSDNWSGLRSVRESGKSYLYAPAYMYSSEHSRNTWKRGRCFK